VTPDRLILLRHGRTAWNEQRRFQGQADPPLDETGRAQADEIASFIVELAPQVLVSSDAIRAMETAERISDRTGLQVRSDARFRERSLGHWEGLTRDEVQRRYPDEFADWIAGRDIASRGGETREEVAERGVAALAEIPQVTTAVVVTHSATAMAISCALLGLSQKVHVLSPLANCHWTELVHDHDLWRLRAHNVGAPGAVLPIPTGSVADSEEAPDAEA